MFPPHHSAPPVPGGVLPSLRHDHLRVRAASPLEEERTEEASPAVLGGGSIHIRCIYIKMYVNLYPDTPSNPLV